MKGEKEIPPDQVRYVAKIYQAGRSTIWGVYDKQIGSWPNERPSPVGVVKQRLASKEEAVAEAERLEGLR